MDRSRFVYRVFTTGFEGRPYDMFAWKKVDVRIEDQKTGQVLFSGTDLEFPDAYSQNACDIIAKMYFRKSGVPETEYETSLKQVIDRMVNFWVAAMIDEGLIEKGEENDPNSDESIISDELKFSLANQMWAPNSPQWFNTGLKMAYGINGEASGEYYWDQEKNCVVESADGYTRSQASACFIVNIKDSLLGEQSLMDNMTTASRLFKYGSGVGSNWSHIRAAGERLSGGGKSSGLMSFQKVYDRNAGAIKSGGVTRRAAVMQILNLDHPEILDFIHWKAREEDKVVALGKMGYDTSINGDAYETVSGQNVNNSVSIPNKFMKMIRDADKDPEKERLWELRGRTDYTVNRKESADLIWEELCWAAWRCGDPGVQFTDTINDWNTCRMSGRIEGSNPCSEYLFLNDTSCNLASINVMKFYKPDTSTYRLDEYLHLVSLIQLVLEATIHWGQFPTPQIAENTYKFRATGVGLTNMGALLMAIGVPYDSKQGRSILAALCSFMTAQAYMISTDMAEKIGPFSEYKKNKKSMEKVIAMHDFAAHHLQSPDVFYDDWEDVAGPDFVGKLFNHEDMGKLNKLWYDVAHRGQEVGFRNAQVSVLAPTGTIAFAMDCDTTSSEPFFSHMVYKKVVDGSWMEMPNRMIRTALEKLGYHESTVNEIEGYVKETGKIEGAPWLLEEHLPVFDTASRNGDGTRCLTPEAHVKMVAALTPHLSGGISKTVNLPEEATVDDVKRIYMLAWMTGCKCIALYRDKCKVVQPLTTKREDVTESTDLEDLPYYELLRLAKDLMAKSEQRQEITREHLPFEPKCIKNAVKMDGYTFHIQRSFYDDGRLGEIFATVGKQGDTVKGLMEVLCILISKSLQYGIPPQVISDILRNTEFSPKGLVRQHPNIKAAMSIPDLISKFIDISVGDYSHCQVKPVPSIDETTPMKWDGANWVPVTVDDNLMVGHYPYVAKVEPPEETPVLPPIHDGAYGAAVPTQDGTDAVGQRKISPVFEGVDPKTQEILHAHLKNMGVRIDRAFEDPASIKKAHGVGERVYGMKCSSCGSNKIVKAGTCYYCKDCGMSSGCS